MNNLFSVPRRFKIGSRVRHKLDKWEGIIDAITPKGQIVVQLKDTYEWVWEREIEFADEKTEKKELKSKTRLDFF